MPRAIKAVIELIDVSIIFLMLLRICLSLIGRPFLEFLLLSVINSIPYFATAPLKDSLRYAASPSKITPFGSESNAVFFKIVVADTVDGTNWKLQGFSFSLFGSC